MVTIETHNDILTITLAEECTISNVEADTDHLRNLPENIKQIDITGTNVRECDTAYLQMLLALKVTAEHQGTVFALQPSTVLDELWKLYLPEN